MAEAKRGSWRSRCRRGCPAFTLARRPLTKPWCCAWHSCIIAHRVETATSAMALPLARGRGAPLAVAALRPIGAPEGVVFRQLADVGAATGIAVCFRPIWGAC